MLLSHYICDSLLQHQHDTNTNCVFSKERLTHRSHLAALFLISPTEHSTNRAGELMNSFFHSTSVYYQLCPK